MSAVESEGEGGGGRRIKAVIYNNQKKVDMLVESTMWIPGMHGAELLYIYLEIYQLGRGGGPITIKSICSKWTLCP